MLLACKDKKDQLKMTEFFYDLIDGGIWVGHTK